MDDRTQRTENETDDDDDDNDDSRRGFPSDATMVEQFQRLPSVAATFLFRGGLKLLGSTILGSPKAQRSRPGSHHEKKTINSPASEAGPFDPRHAGRVHRWRFGPAQPATTMNFLCSVWRWGDKITLGDCCST